MRLRFLLIAVAGTFMVASSALAGGGTSIADAPQLPTHGDVVSGTSNIEAAHVCGIADDATEFYRVSLGAGDLLTVDYFATLPNEIVGIGVLPPFVTDDTLDQAGLASATSRRRTVPHHVFRRLAIPPHTRNAFDPGNRQESKQQSLTNRRHRGDTRLGQRPLT